MYGEMYVQACVVLDLQEVGRFLNLLKDRGQASVGVLAEDNRVERGDEARDFSPC